MAVIDATPISPLWGRRAVVTGAGSGLGRAFAVALARAGAELSLVGRTAESLEQTAAEIESGGGRAAIHCCDVVDRDAVARLFTRMGAVDVLVNSAGTNTPRPFLAVDPDEFDSVFAVNVRGLFFASQAAAKEMRKRESGGVIINVSSQMGHVGAANRSVYCASKHAIEGLTRAVAVELAPYGIRVCSIAPTYVRTRLTEGWLADPTFRAAVEREIPLGRVATVEDIAGAVVFLASDAASFVTGTSLVVDGGYTAH